MPAQTYPASASKVGQYNFGEWVSIFDTRLDDGYMKEIERYGLGSHFMDFLELADYKTNITTRTPKVFERLEWETTVTVGSEIAIGGAGGDISFTVAAADVDASGNLPVMEGEGLVIPASKQTPGEDRIYVISDITGTTVTASPLSADGSAGYPDQSQISVAIPVGTVLKVHGMYKGPGTGQPPGHNTYRAERTYYTSLPKTSMNYEGGINAIKWRDIPSESGVNQVWIEGQELAENFHSKRIDDHIFLGELNDNAALTEASQWGGTNKRLSSQGLWNWGGTAGQDLTYDVAWETSNLYDYKDLIISQNVVSREILFLYGTDLGRQIEEANLDWVREFSGGSDLFRTANEIGVDIKFFKGNGFMFQFQEIKSFANPLRWGNKEYNFSKYGLMFPNQMEPVQIEGRTERHANIALGYLNNNGEDRTRIIRVLDGMSGRMSQAVDQYDGSNLYMLTEFAPLIFRPNQIVRVLPA